MAASLQGGRGKGGRYRPLAEINVTPLVDVMLVLLIIFMVTAPLMSSAVNIDLPKVAATPISQDSEPLKVQVDAQGNVFLQDEPTQLPELVARLQAIAKDQKDRRIFVRGDKGNSYGRMLEVMSTIIQGGFTKVALMTDPSGATTQATTPSVPAAAPGQPAPPARPAPRPAGRS
ncbi:protein TolR [Limobrevibacterium gyesilva]|uniref:Protein TolR n=1 Tax=Limobrevibacterium gyesilva TaxID=2991712 RepID=A0AA41YVS4_9PROT|nr:protein TolR [Limobrevibacterium gyesilva]MCW3477413.1 protein TolR [Limobrevibacterium gyesilva]